jgi:phosphohistidine phosphatase
MMKNLFLLRHAKSSWKDTLLDDFERPLNKRGKRDAPQMARNFSEKGFIVDLIISSSAKRTSDTAKIFADIINYKFNILFKDLLYEASSQNILEVINQLPEKYTGVIIVCHNPGITNIVSYLSGQYIENVPTTGLVGLSSEGNWKEFNKNSCSLLFFDYPKKK